MTVTESDMSVPVPGGLPSLVVTIMGDAVGDIALRIVPTTYQEFQADFPSLLDDLFPARPVTPATSKSLLHYLITWPLAY